MSVLSGKNILLGISGGIAAYKIPFLIRLLVKKNANVKCVITNSARDFITPLTISTLSNRARRIKRLFGLDLIVVDYIQLMRVSSNRYEGRVQEISEITQGLKALAKELSVPVLALSQLSRAVEQRDNNKPVLADLRESGSIEQDADVVMFVYREAYYLERKEPRPATVEYAEWQAKMSEVSNMAEIIVGKQRHGPTGNVFLEFEPMFTKFKDIQNN